MCCCTPRHVKESFPGRGLGGVRNVAIAENLRHQARCQTRLPARLERNSDQKSRPILPLQHIHAMKATFLINPILFPSSSQTRRQIYYSMASISVTRRGSTRLMGPKTINLSMIDIAYRVDCMLGPRAKTTENAHAVIMFQDNTTSDFSRIVFLFYTSKVYSMGFSSGYRSIFCRREWRLYLYSNGCH